MITKTGETQIRFTDKMTLSLYSYTTFAIEEYQFAPEEQHVGRAQFNFIGGAIHALTGLIGKQKPKEFQMKTNLGTLGVRGTEYYSVLDKTLYVTVVEGSVSLSNQAGNREINAGQTGLVTSIASLPQLVQRPASMDRFQGGRPGGPQPAGDGRRNGMPPPQPGGLPGVGPAGAGMPGMPPPPPPPPPPIGLK
ncbi:MAG: FecR domain-containing protein [Magnetococcales bacterium]|nr:FecR domain-containing protein [Magnetococcales bacterium]